MGVERTITMMFVRDGEEVEVEVTGELCPAEPDVGIMSDYVDDIIATHDGQPFALSTREEEHAAEAILEGEDYYDEERD